MSIRHWCNTVHPWDRMNEDEFVQCIKTIVPNPSIQIEIETDKGSELYASDYFDNLDLEPLLDYSWNNTKNIRVRNFYPMYR